MKKMIVLIACWGMILVISTISLANENRMSELRESVQTVREKLVVLLSTKDKGKQASCIKDIQQLSQVIDTRVRKLLADEKTPTILQEKLTQFQAVWTQFGITRDQEIIPRILGGDQSKVKEAKEIARTIQAERFQRMQSLLQ